MRDLGFRAFTLVLNMFNSETETRSVASCVGFLVISTTDLLLLLLLLLLLFLLLLLLLHFALALVLARY